MIVVNKEFSTLRYKMPMLMLKCKTCGIIFNAIYISNMNELKTESKNDSNLMFNCSRSHLNQYLLEDFIDLS
ncbi:conserved protein of unknown function [Candidatus Nitrosocosmicus franklandus]|uniref:Uncharacterized protein n=1 Tax=Candidatus Nitrosocosmicus franklandianus TaxID=1798806 RepID=A0A484ICA4_9ARCH|nr:conserved protein of unknown function [Candidatus Nitrosocosmicus franklandus]